MAEKKPTEAALTQPCGWCAAARKALEEFKRQAAGKSCITVRGTYSSLNKADTLALDTLAVHCTACKNHRKTLTPAGEELAQLALALKEELK